MQSRRATGGVEGKRAHSILVMGQIALTLLLLTSAAAAINGFVRIVHANLGYDPQNVMSVGIPVHQNAHVSWEDRVDYRSEEHTSELQSRLHLVCRLLLEKKKKKHTDTSTLLAKDVPASSHTTHYH